MLAGVRDFSGNRRVSSRTRPRVDGATLEVLEMRSMTERWKIRGLARALAYCAALCVLSTSASGCRKLATLAGVKGKGSSADPAKSRAAVDTLSLYAKGFNVLIDRPPSLLKTYFATVPEAGPEDGKKYQLSADHVAAEPKIAEAKAAFAAATKGAPAELRHLEPLATACTNDVERIAQNFRAAHAYYQAEDFKDDKGEKGKQLHLELAKLAESYRTDIARLQSALTQIENQRADEELAKFSDRTTHSFWFRFFNREAARVINAKPEELGQAFGPLESAHTGLSEFNKNKGSAQAVFRAYADAADRFVNDAKRLKREVEAKAKPEDIASIQDSLTSNYNALIGVSNSLRDLEASGLLK
jgi:hypothetical protein